MNVALRKATGWLTLLRPQIRYFMAGLPPSFLRPSDSRNTEIVSLSIEGAFSLI